MNCVREIVDLLQEMKRGISQCPLHSYHIPIARSRPIVKKVSINDDDKVREHLHMPHYTEAILLFHAALNEHTYTAVRSPTYAQQHLCTRIDHRKSPGCLVLSLRVLWASFLFPEPRRALDVAVQALSKAVAGGDENPPPGLGQVHHRFCGVLRANLHESHDVSQLSIQHRLLHFCAATQWILLDAPSCIVAGGREPFHAQRFACFFSADTSAANELPVKSSKRADAVISKRLELCSDNCHREDVPTLFRV